MKANHLRNVLLFGIAALGFSLWAGPAGAELKVNVNIQLPPPIVFSSPPEVVVMPGTYVYVAPDVEVDIFFCDGFWWRPYEGRWYRSSYYDRGWVYYSRPPVFYRDVPPGWRNDYRQHMWNGQPWRPERMPPGQVQKNWKSWKQGKHWEKQNSWGVQGYKPHPQHANNPRPQGHAGPQHNMPAGHAPSPQKPQVQHQQPQHNQPQPQQHGGGSGGKEHEKH